MFASQLDAALREREVDSKVAALTAGRVGGIEAAVLGSARFSPALFRGLRREIGRCDVAVAHGSSTVLACAAVSLTSRTPFVVRQIGEPAFWLNSWSRRRRVGAYLRRAALVVALSEHAGAKLAELAGVPRSKIRVVPNAVAGDGFRPPSEAERNEARHRFGLDADSVVVLCIGALSPEKGVSRAIDVAAGATGTQLLVAGDGPDRAELERYAAAVAPGRVSFTGSLASPVAAYHAADVVIVPSITEGMPAAAIEAGLCGLPVVAVRVGAVAEVVVDGKTGLLVDADVPDGLAGATQRLVDDEPLRSAMGAAARRRCLERFEIGVVAEQWAAVLEEAARR